MNTVAGVSWFPLQLLLLVSVVSLSHILMLSFEEIFRRTIHLCFMGPLEKARMTH